MAKFFSKVLGRGKDPVSQESTRLQRLALDWTRAEYIPLPPSPPAWEVDGRDEFQREYDDPTIGPVFQAGFQNQHSKVVKLAAGLSAEQRRAE